MARGMTTPRVGFATEVQSIRQPRDDENSVMSYFAKHASRCSACNDPYAAYKQDLPLCSKGNALAKDVANYIYAKGGKPYSVIDRKRGERIQIQIPVGMEVISLLVKAIDRGMVFNRKPLVHAPVENVEVEKLDRSPRKEHSSRKKEYPEERRYRSGDVEIVEIVPSPRYESKKEKTYHTDRTERKERPKSVIYPERRGSLYYKDEEEKRRRRPYEQEPIVIVAEPRGQRYISRR
ncbi:uncharacterized protein A1O9_05038 [Exophiala aquamarina CBS 119918]|uniref:Uncharacterized protein n=1 Tax=Exophiala aquamarina CBS 119918 TaxID=1182545 RepID=A0A072PLH4_9EURO|nr:uncharacterized protein A1O9_05038 [Exophiala aquamarina CBS 119918]KEF60188.1 hypothetical protein A1O9_05038 [Exophiala aquamarina CBS 119918]